LCEGGGPAKCTPYSGKAHWTEFQYKKVGYKPNLPPARKQSMLPVLNIVVGVACVVGAVASAGASVVPCAAAGAALTAANTASAYQRYRSGKSCKLGLGRDLAIEAVGFATGGLSRVLGRFTAQGLSNGWGLVGSPLGKLPYC
jgi:hypothetical protein